MRRLIVLLGIVLLLIVLDSAARSYAGDQVENRLANALNLENDPTVRIGGFPFLWGVVRGRFEDVTVTAAGVRSDALGLSKIQVVLKDVSFPVSEALTGRAGKLTVASARGTARISAPALESALAGLPVDISSLTAGSRRLDISGNQIDLGVAQLPLPVIAEGMQYESAELVNGAVQLRFLLEQTTFSL